MGGILLPPFTQPKPRSSADPRSVKKTPRQRPPVRPAETPALELQRSLPAAPVLPIERPEACGAPVVAVASSPASSPPAPLSRPVSPLTDEASAFSRGAGTEEEGVKGGGGAPLLMYQLRSFCPQSPAKGLVCSSASPSEGEEEDPEGLWPPGRRESRRKGMERGCRRTELFLFIIDAL